MKKSIILFLLFWCVIANAQKMYVTEFKKVNSLEARLHSQRDINGEKCAVIKINTALENLRFDSAYGVTKVEQKNGEYWIYVSPAEVRLEVFTKGYEKLKYNIPLSVEELTTYEMTLRVDTKIVKREESVLPGFLIINSQPQGAIVYINGKNTGRKTPFQKSLPVGRHQITTKLSYYQTTINQIVIEEAQTEKLNLILKPLFTSLEVTSVPSGAEIIIDSMPTGKNTPYTFNRILKGEHTITVNRPMYQTFEQKLDLQSHEKLDFRLKPIFGVLNVNAPLGSDIYIDKRKVGTSRITKKLAEGMYFVEVKREGYETKSYRIDVFREQTKNLNVNNLVREKGILEIISTPFESDVYVNGKHIGKTPLVKRYPVGNYNIVIQKNGYVSKRLKGSIEGGKQVLIEEVLTPLPKKNKKPKRYYAEDSYNSYNARNGFKNLKDHFSDMDSEFKRPDSSTESKRMVSGTESKRMVSGSEFKRTDSESTVRDSESISNAILGLEKPSRSKVFIASALLPGLGRYIAKQDKNITPIIVYTGAIAALVSASMNERYKAENYYLMYKDYRNSNTSFSNDRYTYYSHNWHYSKKMYEKYEARLKLSNVLMYAAIGIYTLNLLEALFLEIEEQGGIAIDINPTYDLNTNTPMLSLNINF